MSFDKELIFNDDSIVCKDDGFEVMMEWERPIMEKVAEFICANGGDILEVGFGMGISADLIQAQSIDSHTIVECHPVILENLRVWASSKPNVTIIEGDWYENTDKLGQYDGIFHDTFGDHNWKKFDDVISTIAKPGCRYTDWNSGGDREYWEDYEHLAININPPENKYFNENVYYMPMVIL